MINAYLGILF